jgi:thiol-disulfide isomerase/thioredoxin
MTTKTKTKTPTTGTKTQQKGRRIPILPIVFGVVAAALIAAIVLGNEEPIGSAGEYGEPTITGDSLPFMEPGAAIIENDAANGLVAPEVTGQDFDGNTVSIEHDGTPKAIAFVAHWCSHCQVEIPRVQAWLDAGGGVEGVEVYAVTTSANSGQPNWPPSEWMTREGWSSPIIRDDQDNTVLVAYGGNSFPYWVFLNGDGTVALRVAGETNVDVLTQIMAGLEASS